jgi:hypothetical protein
MTGYSTTINAGYGQGTYVASASSELNTSYQAWTVFDKLSSTFWHTAVNYNNTTTNSGTYTGSIATVDVNGASYSGEWLQIQLPLPIVLSNYSIMPRALSEGMREPRTFWILGSRDGFSWFLVDARSGINTWVAPQVVKTFSASSAQSFTYFRIVVYQVGNASSGNSGEDSCQISEWILNGIIESVNISADGRVGLGVVAPVQALEVAGNSIVYGNVGIGTTNPQAALHVNGTLRSRGTIINMAFISSTTGWSNTANNTLYDTYSLSITPKVIGSTLIVQFTPQVFAANGSGGVTDVMYYIYDNVGAVNISSARTYHSATVTNLNNQYKMTLVGSKLTPSLSSQSFTLRFLAITGSLNNIGVGGTITSEAFIYEISP